MARGARRIARAAHEARARGLRAAAAAWLTGTALLGGCASQAPTSRLPREYQAYMGTSPGYMGAGVRLRWVDSLQPTLRWDAFPGPRDRYVRGSDRAHRIDNVTYELRVWRTDKCETVSTCGNHGYPLEEVYSRRGLPVPMHQLETPLEPGTAFLWTARARFDLDGEPRVTQWRERSPDHIGEVPFVPSPFYSGFVTPAR